MWMFFSAPSDTRPLVKYLYDQLGKDVEELETMERFSWLDGDIRLPINEQKNRSLAFYRLSMVVRIVVLIASFPHAEVEKSAGR